MMKRFYFMVLLIAAMVMTSCSKYRYETVSGDPTKTRIYTLDNGLKVYMSVNKETPRIQTFVAVRVGAKNDPAETTGLAHYFEHLMFKGTDKFGTMDYEAEKPLLDEIEQLFEVYRNTTDEKERKAIYARIDSVSQEASKYFIPNEYDKLMAAIGSNSTNAWTSNDETVYMEDIPANEVENWAKIQADRFASPVIRGFHTELETVYEEYNMGLTDDSSKAWDKIWELMLPDHPYGQHSVIGLQEHLKNPSITNIKNYYKTYYVPNNMAVCMSGDFDPDEAIEIIDRYFGKLVPNENLPKTADFVAEPLSAPVSAEVYGLESEQLLMGWVIGPAKSDDGYMSQIVASILNNGRCGLIDTDIIQKQAALSAYAYNVSFADAGAMLLEGAPKEGQTLDQVRDLLLAEVERLRNGDFDESLLSSIIANYRRTEMAQRESNFMRAYGMVSSFITGKTWKDYITETDRAAKLTKDEIVKWANEKLKADSYAIVYKREGEDKTQKKIEKPHITPIETNRDAASQYLTDVQNTEVAPIEPVFIDFEKDMAVTNMNGNISVLYKKNEVNDLFSLIYLYDFGTAGDPEIDMAVNYMELLGTDTESLEEIQRELYAIACSFDIVAASDRTYVVISGLGDNMEKAMTIAENYMKNVKGDDAVLAEVKRDVLKQRANAKLDESANFSALIKYSFYGADAVRRSTLTNDELNALTSDELLAKIKNLCNYKHRVMYYGPESKGKLIQTLNTLHNVAENPQEVDYKPLQEVIVTEPTVTLAQYDSKQIRYVQYSCRGDRFDVSLDPMVRLYNDYFSGGMNSIVFQEMREARGLAYTAYTDFSEGATAENPYKYFAFIATQNDKLRDAVTAFDEIIENMPQSEHAFEIAKESLLTSLATNRRVKSSVLWAYVDNCNMGVNFDRNKVVYEKVKDMTLQDVVDFQNKYVKGRVYNCVILGDRKNLDMKYLKSLGKVNFVSQEEIFGY